MKKEDIASAFREDHAISREVWKARPFERYFRTPEEARRVKALYEGSGLRPGQLGDITKIVMNELDRCAGGFVIHRHEARDVGAGPVYPQLRPDEPVARELIYHWHGDREPKEWPRHPRTGKPIPEFRIYRKPTKGWGLSMLLHIAKGSDGRPARAVENLHRGVNDQGLHAHQVLAKYVFPSSLLKDLDDEHVHADLTLDGPRHLSADDRLEKLLRHIEKHHRDDDESSFPGLDELHDFKVTVKDRDRPLAQRLDVEPAFYHLLGASELVYFGIEGSVKGSAMSSAGVPAFTVPSVTMWPANELDAFARRYLANKVVVIVPDNDWYDNPAVVAQAFLCRTYLRRRLNVWAVIASPPDREFDANGKLKKVGVDDFLACGGDPLDMNVVDRDANNPRYQEWIAARLPAKTRARRRDWIKTLADSFEGLALHAKFGRVQLPYATVARVMDLHEKQVERAIADLLECGAITSDIDPRIRRGVWRGRYDPLGLEFAHRPTFTLHPDLEAGEVMYPLRENRRLLQTAFAQSAVRR